MTPNNWVATISAFLGFGTALLTYLRQRRIDRVIHKVNFNVNGRFTDVLAENQRLRSQLAALTGDPRIAELPDTDEIERQG